MVLLGESEEVLRNLLSECQLCINHKPQLDTFSSPSFLEELSSPLTTMSMPMETSDVKSSNSALGPSTLPWNDKIKNFVMDITSHNNSEKFESCIVLAECDYSGTSGHGSISLLTAEALRYKHCKDNHIFVAIEPKDSSTEEFTMLASYNNKEISELSVSRHSVVETIMPFYRAHETLVLCHDSSVEEYRNVLMLMSDAFWSISCTPTYFTGTDSELRKCKYMCTVFSHNLSKETRAVGQGMVLFGEHLMPPSYIGKVNYYQKCVRGAKHSTGRCYDCKMLYDAIVSVGMNSLDDQIDEDVIVLTDELTD